MCSNRLASFRAFEFPGESFHDLQRASRVTRSRGLWIKGKHRRGHRNGLKGNGGQSGPTAGAWRPSKEAGCMPANLHMRNENGEVVRPSESGPKTLDHRRLHADTSRSSD